MKPTGIIRRVDELGRIVIPKEMRTKLDIDEGTPIEIRMDGDTIVLKKDLPACIFCGADSEIIDFKGKKVCMACLSALRS